MNTAFSNLFDGYLHYIRECVIDTIDTGNFTIPYPYYNQRLIIMVTGHILFSEVFGISLMVLNSNSTDPNDSHYRPLKIVKVGGSDHYMNTLKITSTGINTFSIDVNHTIQTPIRGCLYSLCKAN